MKKILYLHAGAELYGADIVMLELIKRIDKEKYEPVVILPNDGQLVKKLRDLEVNVIVQNYPILRRKYFNLKGIIKYCFEYIKYSKKIIKYIKKENIDILHINTSAVLEGAYIKKKTGIRTIWHIHEILVKPKFISKFIYNIIARYSDEIVCVSEAVKEHFMKITNRRDVKVIYNGVDNSKFNKNINCEYLKKEFDIKDEDIVVGMIGRVNAWKGQNDFLNAMELIFPKVSNLKALIVGGVFEGQEWRMQELEKNINESKYSDKIIFSDYRQDSANIHKLIDIFILPSINPDPLPTVVLEAMASAKPIVGYRHGGICEMVEDGYNGYLANVKDVKDLANKIWLLIENQELRILMGNRSEERQKKYFSLDAYVSNFEKLYE